MGAEWLTLAPGARVPLGLPHGSGAPEARPLTVQWTAAEHTHSGVTRQGSQRSDESGGAGAGSSALLTPALGECHPSKGLRIRYLNDRTARGQVQSGFMPEGLMPALPGGTGSAQANAQP